MGRPLITQRRGKGSPSFTAPSHRFKAEVCYKRETGVAQRAQVVEIIDDPARTVLLMKLKYDDGVDCMLPAAEGVKIGDFVTQGAADTFKIGDIATLAKIPEGYPVFNIEIKPNAGGNLARASGSVCFIVSKTDKIVNVKLPSGKVKEFMLGCRATVGNAAGGGRVKKPMLKASVKWYKRKARGQLYPIVRGVHQNPVEHPYGGKEHHGAKTPKGVGGAPGQHVGSFGARRTGRKKR